MQIRNLFLLVLLLTTAAQAKILSFTPRTAFQIKGALKTLKSGDRIVFHRGTYNLANGLTISGLSDIVIEGKGEVELVVGNLNDAVLSFEDCQNVQIRGLSARHQRPADDYQCEGAVVRVVRCQQIFISENRLNGCGAAGVYGMTCKDLVIYKNRIFNNSFAGVWLHDVSATVHDNKIYDNASALITYGKCDVSLTENEVENNSGNIFNDTAFFRRMTGKRR